MSRRPLPIDPLLPELVAILRSRPNCVLSAATGAGKTTRVPPALLPLAEGKIIMLEPRRVAARAAARRMAEEMGEAVGKTVGYQVRFDRKQSAQTRILVVTEGILVQMLQGDPFLEDVSCLIFDEFHERNLHADLSLAMARKVQREARDDLRMVVMSATLDADPLVQWLGGNAGCGRLHSPGRQFPVTTEYLLRQDARGIPTQVREGVLRMLDWTPGDVLVFLPGVGEIRRCQEFLKPDAEKRDIEIQTLYGDLSPERQDAVLRPGRRRRVILSTNVAETSITLNGVTGVVDSGQVRVLRFDPAHGLNRLQLGRISRASAEQRKGRAGRQQEGHCLRLWTEHDDRSLQDREVPEVQRVDLASSVLELLAWGESDLLKFPWFEDPPGSAVEQALLVLVDLGACRRQDDGAVEITAMGRTLARLPVHPRLARLLVAGHGFGVPKSAARIAALISERDVVFRPSAHRPVRAMASAPSDLLDRLDGIEDLERGGYGETALGPVDRGRAKQVLRVAERLASLTRKRLGPPADLETDRESAVLRSILAAYPDRVARRREPGSRRGLMVGGKGIRLAEMSAVQDAELFLCVELEGAKGRHSDGLVRQASAIDKRWLDGLETAVESRFDPGRERAVGFKVERYRDLVLSEGETDPGPERAATVLARAAGERLDAVLPATDTPFGSFVCRVRCLGQWCPELGLPAVDDEHLRSLLPHLTPGRRSFDELRRAPWLDVLRGGFDFAQLTAVDRLAPEHLPVPSGSQIRLRYEAGKPPVLAVRIQELFGRAETPTVAEGRVPVLLHLLAPNMRPQQVTQDLKSFWANTYPEVKKDLAGRYPKHAWPDDPLSAPAMRGAKRRKSR